MAPTVQNLQPIKCRVRTSYEQDGIAPAESGTTSSSDTEVTLQSDDDNLRILCYQLSKLCPGEGVIFGFVDDLFASQGFVDKLPAWGAELIWFS